MVISQLLKTKRPRPLSNVDDSLSLVVISVTAALHDDKETRLFHVWPFAVGPHNLDWS